MEPVCKNVKVQLVGQDGNAFAILGRITRAMKDANVSQDIIKAFQSEAMSGDYDNLLRVCMKYVSC